MNPTARRSRRAAIFLQARQFILQSAYAHDKIFTLEISSGNGADGGHDFVMPASGLFFFAYFGAEKRKGALFCVFAGPDTVKQLSPDFAFVDGCSRKQRREPGAGRAESHIPLNFGLGRISKGAFAPR
jgi:hypothetical protein